jgi:hypothetical protein
LISDKRSDDLISDKRTLLYVSFNGLLLKSWYFSINVASPLDLLSFYCIKISIHACVLNSQTYFIYMYTLFSTYIFYIILYVLYKSLIQYI